jgi:1-acyl-sn-glycerol-3-phosphate acyltransferase
MERFFSEDSYTTPANTPRFLSDRLFGWTRWSYYARFFNALLWAKYLAERNVFIMQEFAAFSRKILFFTEGCGGRFLVEGLDHIRAAVGPVVFVGNHMSSLETVLLPGIIWPLKPVTFVVKEKLLSGHFFGPIVRSVDPIAVTRKNAREDLRTVMTRGARRLAAGTSVVVFPQNGTHARSVRFDRAKFNSLGVKLASRAGVSVIPFALKTDFWGDGAILHDLGTIRRAEPICFAFGAPIAITGHGKEAQEHIVAFIESRLAAWGVPIARNGSIT